MCDTTPKSQDTPEEKIPSKEDIAKMASDDKKEIANLEVELPPQPDEGLYAFMVGLLKSNAGYPYVAASQITNYDPEGKKNSITTAQLALWYKIKGGKSQDEFVKLYTDPRVVIIQLFAECPTMAADGMYDQIGISGKKIKTIPCGVRFLAEGETFEPTIIMRTGACKPSEIGVLPNTLGMVHGDPFHKMTAAETEAAVQHVMGDKKPTSDAV